MLPTYDQIGITAPILLTVLRALQGIGVGGEWGGAVLLALEMGHRGRRGFFASWPQAGVPLGLLSSAGVMWLVERGVGDEAFLAWGWRLPFFLSALLIVIGLLIRMRITETPLFRQLQQDQKVAHAPVAEVIRHHWGRIVLAAGARVVENACFYLFSVHVLDYSEKVLALKKTDVLPAVYLAAAIEFFMIPLYGVLSDRFSRKAVYIGGCLFLMAFAWPYYAMLQTREAGWMTLAVVLSLIGGHASLYAVQASLIPELFGTRLRYSGSSIGYQLAAPFAGGLAPIVASWLAHEYPGQTWMLAGYIMTMSLLSLVCVLGLAETSRRSIAGEV
jgi:MFS family permease